MAVMTNKPSWGWLPLLISAGVVQAFVAGWLTTWPVSLQVAVWVSGAACFAFGLVQLLSRWYKLFLFVGFFIAFGVVLSGVYQFFDRTPPAFVNQPLEAWRGASASSGSGALALDQTAQQLTTTVGDWLAEQRADSARRADIVKLVNQTLYGRAVEVRDGDTLVILMENTQYEVRLAEIDTPEMDQPWGREAKQALRNKVIGQSLRVDVIDVDDYGRAVGRAWLGPRDINRELVAEGHAWVYRRHLRDRTLLDDEQTARRNNYALWQLDDPIAPWSWRQGERVADAGCNIKGNIASSGERIYHKPGQKDYPDTQISTAKGERWFCSEAEARAAGWRAAKA